MLRLCFLLAAVCLLSATADECRDKIELGFLIDMSKSYGEGADWMKVKSFVELFLNNYDIALNKSRLGVITYANKANILFGLNDKEYQSGEVAKNTIDAALTDIKLGGKTLTEKALLKVHDQLFKKPPSDNKQRVLFVFSRGKTPNPDMYEDVVKSLEGKGVNIVAVSGDEEESAKIAGKRGHVIVVKDIDDALVKLPEMVQSTCLIHGGYAEWGEWGADCSKTCGGGQQTRQRTCSNPVPSESGNNCDDLGPAESQRPCNIQPCGDIDGGYTKWTDWSVCSHTCGGGRKKRHRLCVNPPQQENGKHCDGPDTQTKKCNKNRCKALKAPCEEGLDLGILIDQSLSVATKNLEALLKTFFPPYIKTLTISKSKTHVGFVRFYKYSHFEFNFADRRYYSSEALINKIESLDAVTIYMTRIDRGLLSARHELFTKRGGDRRSRQNVLLVFTDGRPVPEAKVQPFNETIPPLTDEKQVHIVAVGFGRKGRINKPVLQEIAGDNVVIMRDAASYPKHVNQIKRMVCRIDGGYTQWSMWSLCSAPCGEGTQIRSRTCTAPPRRKGGKDCKGEHSEVRVCGEVQCQRPPRTCEGLTLDLAIVFDVSYRLGEQHFRFAKEFIDKLLRLYDVSPSGTRVSLVVFTGVAHSVISFHQEDYQNRDALEFVLNYLTPSFSMGKRLDRALEYVNDNVFSLARGDRPDVNNTAVFITDGKIINGNEDISGLVTALRDDKNVNMITVSVGTKVREEVLYEIAGPKMSLCTSYQDLLDKPEHIADLACAAPQ